MALTPECVLSPAAENNYCIDIRATSIYLFAAFNSSNTVTILRLGSRSPEVREMQMNGILSEICPIHENTIACCYRNGGILVYDVCAGTTVSQFTCNEE